MVFSLNRLGCAQALGETVHCLVHEPADRAGFDPQHFADLVIGQPLVYLEAECLAFPFREQIQFAAQNVARFSVFAQANRSWHGLWNLSAVSTLHLAGFHLSRVVGEVAADSVKPGAQRVLSAKFRRTPNESHEGLLDQVLSRPLIANEAARKAQQRGLVTLHQMVQRKAVTAAKRAEQGSVRGFRQRTHANATTGRLPRLAKTMEKTRRRLGVRETVPPKDLIAIIKHLANVSPFLPVTSGKEAAFESIDEQVRQRRR